MYFGYPLKQASKGIALKSKRPGKNRGAKKALYFFSHPDYTVGTGIAPVRGPQGPSQTLLPVETFTPPQRIFD